MYFDPRQSWRELLNFWRREREDQNLNSAWSSLCFYLCSSKSSNLLPHFAHSCLRFLSTPDVASCSRVCKAWHTASLDPSLWKVLLLLLVLYLRS